MTDIERKAGMTQAQVQNQIAANKIKIDKQLERLHQARLEIEELRRKSDEKVRKYLEGE